MDWEEERKQKEKKQAEVTQGIATALGWGVVINKNEWQGVISKGDWRLNICVIDYGVQKGRVSISGNFNGLNQFIPYNRKNEKTIITVAGNKPFNKISKDIKSRLLPIYQTHLKEAQERKQNDDDYKANKKAMIADIATYITSPDIREDLVYGKSLTVKFTTIFNFEDDTQKDGFELEVTLTPDKMKKVLAVIYDM